VGVFYPIHPLFEFTSFSGGLSHQNLQLIGLRPKNIFGLKLELIGAKLELVGAKLELVGAKLEFRVET